MQTEPRPETIKNLLRELDISRPVHLASSVGARYKVLEDICSSIRTVVKVRRFLCSLYLILISRSKNKGPTPSARTAVSYSV